MTLIAFWKITLAAEEEWVGREQGQVQLGQLGRYCHIPTTNDDCPEQVRGDNFPWISNVSACLRSEALAALFLDQLFKDFCMSNSLGSDNVSLQNNGKVCLQPEEEQIVSPHSSQSKEKVCLLPIIKDVGSPSSVFLSCHVSLCVQESFGTH